jgi:hypothetical protein
MGAGGSGETPGEGGELTGIDEARRRIAEAANPTLAGAKSLDQDAHIVEAKVAP